jgi:hypothetical protein
MNAFDPQPRDSTAVSALATMLAAAVVLSVGVASGSLGNLAPAAAVNAVFMGGMHHVAASGSAHPSARMEAPRNPSTLAVATVDRRIVPAESDRISIAGPSGPAASNLPPPHAG